MTKLRSREHRALIAVFVAARNEQNVTQRELADRLRKPHSYVSKFEAGERKLGVVEFGQMSKALNVDPEVMYSRYMHWLKSV